MTERQVELVGGPLDGATMPGPMVVADDALETGAYLIVAGEERRAVYEPLPDADPYVWHYRGMVPA